MKLQFEIIGKKILNTVHNSLENVKFPKSMENFNNAIEAEELGQ